MSRRPQSLDVKLPLDLIEETVGILRALPARVYLAYYLGAAPFWLALLYFVADMSHGAFAGERLIGGSLALAPLFIWMKCWQSVFAQGVEARVLLRPEADWNGGRITRMIGQQAWLQPLGLILRPIALITTIPFVWVSGFFQSVTALGDGASESAEGSVASRALRQARLWPGQAHMAYIWLFVFALFVFANVLSAFMVAPGLLKMFFDIDTDASRSSSALFNSTSLTAALAITVLCVDPIFKALFVLRCFYGESIRSGLDLRVQLRRLKRNGVTFLTIVACMLGAISPAAMGAAADKGVVPPEELSESVREVLQRREYAWRVPEEKSGEQIKNTTAISIGKWLRDQIRAARKQWNRFMDWLFKKDKEDQGDAGGFSLPREELAYVLVAIAVAIIALGLWRRLRQTQGAVQAEPLAAAPDLTSEDVTADQLPEDGWLSLMQRALAEGQRRAAIRAAYLATLAHLGSRELLTIARHKSNRDYDKELNRRARSRAELLNAFRENLVAFESVWYGEHDVTDDGFDQFRRNLEVIRSC